MLHPYDLMEQLLSTIEDHITETVTISDLSNRFYIFAVHLQRLFKFVFGIIPEGMMADRFPTSMCARGVNLWKGRIII